MIKVERGLPSPTPLLTSERKSRIDLRLMHHFCTATVNSMNCREHPANKEAWSRHVPQMAFEHDFLMDNLLALAAVHLCHEAPHLDNNHMTAFYSGKALQSYRKALANLSRKNIFAVIIASIILSFSSLVTNRGEAVKLQGIQTGISVLLKIAGWEAAQSPIAPILGSVMWVVVPSRPITIPPKLQQMVDDIDDSDPDAPHRGVLQSCLTTLGKLYGGLLVHGLRPGIHLEILAWQFMTPGTFPSLVMERRPRCLVIFAHYLVLFEFLPRQWWTIGVAKQEVMAVSAMLGPEWQSLISVPLAAVQLCDTTQIAELLLTQLPTMDPTNPLPMEPFFPAVPSRISEDES